MLKFIWYRFIRRYSPEYFFVRSGVKIYFSKRCTKPIVLHKLLFLPIRYYKVDNNIMFAEISDFLRKAYLKK